MKARIFTDDFNRLIDATKNFVSKDFSARTFCRYINLLFDAENSNVTAVAIDGFRMSVEHCSITDCDENFAAYVPTKIKLPKNKYAELELDNGQFIIRCEEFMFGFVQPEKVEQFNYKKFLAPLDEKPVFRIGFDARFLIDALNAAKASCGNAFKAPIALEFYGPLAPAFIRTNDGDIKLIQPVRLKDE